MHPINTHTDTDTGYNMVQHEVSSVLFSGSELEMRGVVSVTGGRPLDLTLC